MYKNTIIFILSFGTFWLCTSLVGASQPDTAIMEPAAQLSIEQEADSFTYDLEGRPDPFVPFISPKAVSTESALNPNEIVEEDEVLSGMRLFEPGQLTLVAILSSQGKKMAMVEDVTGKGYILNEGMLIGRRGVVDQITQEQVLIKETARTRAGEKRVNTVEMRLNKEGDE